MRGLGPAGKRRDACRQCARAAKAALRSGFVPFAGGAMR
jgi:hypothetical protein